MYTSLGLTALVYVLHGIILNGWDEQHLRMSLDWALITLCLFVAGVGLYALRVWLPLFTLSTSLTEHRSRNDGFRWCLISLAPVIKYSICW
jgi:hypothetical protein